MASLEDVAKACNVSIATVSRVFSRQGNVAKPTMDRILAAARKLNYSPKGAALRDSMTVVVEDLEKINFSGYTSMLLASLLRQTATRGLGFNVVLPEEVGVLRSKFVYGIVSIVYGRETRELLDQVSDIPMVTLNDVRDRIPAVVSNDDQGMRMAVEHLYELGHRRIGLRASGRGFSVQRRIDAFRAAVSELGIDASDSLVAGGAGNHTEKLAKLLQSKPTALIAATERLGIAAAQSLALLGRRIPEDISLVAMEASGVSALLSPPHTTIAQDFNAMASAAIEVLQSHYSGEKPKRKQRIVEVDFKMHVRESTAAP